MNYTYSDYIIVLINKKMSDNELANIKFMDPIEKFETKDHERIKCILEERNILNYLLISAKKYNYLSWKEYRKKFSTLKLRSLIFNRDWDNFFDIIESKRYFKNIENILNAELSSNTVILPYPELLFNIFNILSPQKIKVVFIGQDPYINIDDNNIPQATGVSFSVPIHFKLPPSLINIFSNMIEFKHIKKIPDNGCLAYWIMQGCFMFNSALTTVFEKSNQHKDLWRQFSEDLISYLSKTYSQLIFVAWGSQAHRLCINVDYQNHYIITSSHPSPLSAANSFTGLSYKDKKTRITYQSFKSIDHFGLINTYLASKNDKIYWNLFATKN